MIPRYGSIDLKGARRVYDRLAVLPRAGALRHRHLPGPRRVSALPGGLPAALRPQRASTANPAWTIPITTSASPCFARAALAVARFLFRTEIFHCHDWQAGLVPAYLRTTFATDPTFLGVKTLFTIHNLGYQGLFPKTALAEGGARPRRLPARRHGVLRPRQLHQGRHRVRRRAHHRQPHLCARNPDARVRLRPGWRACAPAPACSPASSTASITASGTRKPIRSSRPAIPPTIWRQARLQSSNCWPNSACRRRPWTGR